MKARYKIGMLVEFTAVSSSTFGVIEGVMTKKEGYAYQIANFEGFVSEKNVISAYRPVTARTKTAKKATTTRTTKRTNANQESAFSA